MNFVSVCVLSKSFLFLMFYFSVYWFPWWNYFFLGHRRVCLYEV